MSGTKIKKIAALVRIVSGLKRRGKRIVFTNGCFDILHFGHVQYLQRAKQCGDILVVGLNSDASVRRLKGRGRPIIKEGDRSRVLAALTCVDYVVAFNEDTPYAVIQKIRPDILVKGADWNKKKIVGADVVTGYGGKVATISFIKGRSTTSIINKIANTYKRHT